MQLFGDSNAHSLVRISRLNWVGHVNRMGSNGEVCQVFNGNPQGSRLRGRPQNRWWNREQTGTNKFRIKKLERQIEKQN